MVAAAVPIAGEGRPAFARAGCALGDTPIRAFTGLLGDTFDPQGSNETMQDVRACPGVDAGAAKLTQFPDRDQQLGSGVRRSGRLDLRLDAAFHDALRRSRLNQVGRGSKTITSVCRLRYVE